ncbi:MAG TPA: hypothetical protein VHI32_04630 [Burkholderiales bacterium]|jgi:hypothetical protein|nr:hypothetical protein [Burkholderiales bacterium]
MDPIFFVFAWLAYVATFWLASLCVFDADQDAPQRGSLMAPGKFLQRLYARKPRFAAPQ